MGALRRFGAFAYDFVIGDDWTVAVAVVAAVALTWALAGVTRLAWLVMPLAVAAMLSVSVLRARRSARPAAPPGP